MKQSVILLILDGLGIGQKDSGNPISVAKPKTLNYIRQNFLSGSLQASGIAVGLPWEEPGNSQIGHLSLGIGKVYYHNYPRISLTIRNGTFYNNGILKSAIQGVLNKKSRLHLIGLLSKSNQVSSSEHLEAILKMAEKQGLEKVYLHLISDGQDGPPRSFLDLWKGLQSLSDLPELILTSISGRYYAMNDSADWQKTKLYYSTLLGENKTDQPIEAVLQKYYDKDLDDRFIEPHLLVADGCISQNDSVLFFNFEDAGIRQIAQALADKNFKEFPVRTVENVSFFTLTDYGSDIQAGVVFPKEIVTTSLSQYLSEHGKNQLKIGETIKQNELTYFFNGFHDHQLENEYHFFVPSLDSGKIENQPQMKLPEITNRLLESIKEGIFDLIVVNIPNLDVLTHQRNFSAVLKAVNLIDAELEKILDVVLKGDHILIITSDHGFCEHFYDSLKWEVQKYHTKNPVPFYLVGNSFRKEKNEHEATYSESKNVGILTDVAPTILSLMKIPSPQEFEGKSILDSLT